MAVDVGGPLYLGHKEEPIPLLLQLLLFSDLKKVPTHFWVDSFSVIDWPVQDSNLVPTLQTSFNVAASSYNCPVLACIFSTL